MAVPDAPDDTRRSAEDADVAEFEAARGMVSRVAYRMLGSLAEAEDVVQDAWLRWSSRGREPVRNPAAFLRRTVTRLCLDRLKSARTRHETYEGTWLPEPVVEAEAVEDVTLPLMLALERLSPLERAAFLLHDVFGESFEEVAAAVRRDPAACRQLASRARDHVRAERRRFPVSAERGKEIAEAFVAASRAGDVVRLGALLAEDVRLYSDGGGKRLAIPRVLEGADVVNRALLTIASLLRPGEWSVVRYAFVNGLPGVVTREADGLLQTTALLIDCDRIAAIYFMRNPDKLRHLEVQH